MFKLEFTTDNATFSDGDDRAESARILGRIVQYLGEGYDSGLIHDDNGNRIGDWSLTDPKPPQSENAPAEYKAAEAQGYDVEPDKEYPWEFFALGPDGERLSDDRHSSARAAWAACEAHRRENEEGEA